MDPKTPIEETVKTLVELVKEGKFNYIGLSECSAETLKRANAVCSCHPVLVPTNYVSGACMEMTGVSDCCGRDRGQPLVLRRRNEER